MRSKLPWLCAVSFIGCISFIGGMTLGHSMKVEEKTKTITVTKEVEVIKEVLSPSICLDTFLTKTQYLNDAPHCDHPAQVMEVKVVSAPDSRPWLEIKCKCPH